MTPLKQSHENKNKGEGRRRRRTEVQESVLEGNRTREPLEVKG